MTTQEAIEILKRAADSARYAAKIGQSTYWAEMYAKDAEALEMAIDVLKSLGDRKAFRWCRGCKEHDQKTQSCHRWSTQIRDAIETLELIRCEDCANYDRHDKRCKVWNHGVEPWGFCNEAERAER